MAFIMSNALVEREFQNLAPSPSLLEDKKQF